MVGVKIKMRSKKKFVLLSIGIIIVIIGALLFLRSPEDSWIKDSKGIYVMHGNPASAPDNVKEQQEAITCANDFYNKSLYINVSWESQCLGTCGDYAVDFVKVPRTDEDNLAKNQCDAYLNGSVKHFIEINSYNGEIVRII